MKLNEDGYENLKEELTKKEGPFSRTDNVMLAFDLIEKGEDLSSGLVTKSHLINIIKVLCSKLDWTEEQEEQEEIKTEEPAQEQNEENKEVKTNAKSAIRNSEQICKFYKNGNCHYGRSGKKIDKQGRMCSFSHPIT